MSSSFTQTFFPSQETLNIYIAMALYTADLSAGEVQKDPTLSDTLAADDKMINTW